MKNIFSIAKAELRYLFCSPIAWFLILIFYIFATLYFMAPLYKFSLVQEVYLDNDPAWLGFESGLSETLLKSLLKQVFQNMYLFMPLLTMALINREYSDRTIPLLYSTPIKTREIVGGKYLGIVLFNFVLLFIVAFALTSTYIIVKEAQYIWFLGVLLGLFLLINTYAAIGMFLSSLTKYPIVAAVFTFLLFFILNNIAQVGRDYEIIRDITYFLFIANKTNSMMVGLISTANVAYFVLIIILFVGITIVRLKSQRESKSTWIVAGRYGLLISAVLVLGVLSSLPKNKLYWDLTYGKTNTIHPITQSVIEELDGSPLKVTLYSNLFADGKATGLGRNRHAYIYGFWEQYLRFYPNVEFNYCDYYLMRKRDSLIYFGKYPNKTMEEIVRIESDLLNVKSTQFIPYEQISDEIDLSKEYFPVMVLEYKGKRSLLRCYKDTRFWPEQRHFAASIKRLTRSKEPKVAFTVGHLERSMYNLKPRDYANDISTTTSRGALINNGVDADTISLVDNELPGELDLLVIADPKTPFTSIEKDKITRYLNQGGNAILISEPGKSGILQPVTELLGVQLEQGVIVNPNAHEVPQKIELPLTHAGNHLAKEPFMDFFQQFNKGGSRGLVFGSLNLSFTQTNNFVVKPLISLKGKKDIWIENGLFVSDSTAPTFAKEEGDVQKEQYDISISLTRRINNKEQRIIIIGDGDFLSHERKHPTLGLAFYSWPLNNTYPIYVNYPPVKDKYIGLQSATIKVLLYVFCLGVPIVILISAIILLVRRRRR